MYAPAWQIIPLITTDTITLRTPGPVKTDTLITLMALALGVEQPEYNRTNQSLTIYQTGHL